VGPVEVTAVPVVHASGAPAYGLRLGVAGQKVVDGASEQGGQSFRAQCSSWAAIWGSEARFS
jgi:hypothetical protein